MSHSPAPEDAHLATITKQILDLMGSLNTFTYMSVTALLNLDTKGHRRLYDVLCALEGIGLLSKDRKLYTWKRQWYQLPIFKDNSMSRHIGTVYRYVRNNPGMFMVQDLVRGLGIPLRRMYDSLRVLALIGVVTKLRVGCYETAPQSVCSDPEWKRVLETIWGGGSSEVRVVENQLPEDMSIDSNDIGSDTHILQIDSPEYPLLYIHNDGVVWEAYIVDNNSGVSVALGGVERYPERLFQT